MATSFHTFPTVLFTLYSYGRLHVFPSANETETPGDGNHGCNLAGNCCSSAPWRGPDSGKEKKMTGKTYSEEELKKRLTPQAPAASQVATLAGGCFWGMQ